MKNSNQLKNRIDALSPDEGPIPTDPKKMTDKQLMTRIIHDKFGRAPHPYELTPEGSSRLIEMLREERDK